MNKQKKIQKEIEEIRRLAEMLGLNPATQEATISVYPDEFRGVEFDILVKDGADIPRKKLKHKTQHQIIKGFRSHDWKKKSDIYGHQGLDALYVCKKCEHEMKVPMGKWTDDFILSFYWIFGRHKKFGGRISKCK